MTDTSLAVRKQASYWLIALETAPDINTIWPEFESWLDQDPEHVRAYDRMEAAWRDAGEMIRSMSRAQLDAYLTRRRTRWPRWILGTLLFLAAATLVLKMVL